MKVITLSENKQLKIFMHPTRQQILHLLSVQGAMTPKMVSTALDMTSSSAKHHLLKLVELGAVEIDHQELIHGIRATYYARTQATISIGSMEGGEREVLAQNLLKQVQDGFFSEKRTFRDEEGHFLADMNTGVLHLSPQEADELYLLIRSYICEHEQKREGTSAFVYSWIGYHA